jgi:lysine biosynthesis protein LysW
MVDKRVVRAQAAECPACGEKIALRGAVKIGRRVTCPLCESELEVVETIPVELDWYDEGTDEEDKDW